MFLELTSSTTLEFQNNLKILQVSDHFTLIYGNLEWIYYVPWDFGYDDAILTKLGVVQSS